MNSTSFTLLFISGLLIFLGIRFRRQGMQMYGKRLRSLIEKRWLKQLLSWGVASAEDNASHLLPEIVQRTTNIASAATIGAGIGGVISSLVYSVSALAVPGLAVVQDALPWFHLVPEMVCLSVGYLVGYTIGVQQQRLTTLPQGTYADLRQRRLSDYRSPLLLPLAILFIVFLMSITALLTSHVGPDMAIQGILGEIVPVGSFPWLWWILPTGMIVVLLICEIAMRQVVASPRLLLTSDVATAQRADQLVRAGIVGRFQSVELFFLGMLSIGQWLLLRYEFSRLLPFENAVTLALVIGISLLGLWLDEFAGRLGGTITGWPWRKKVLA